MVITSVSNPHIRYVRTLASDKRAREADGVIVLEGANLIDALPVGAEVAELLVQEGKADKYRGIIERFGNYIEVSDNVMRAVSSVNTPQGIVAAAKFTLPEADRLKPAVIADGITDPGNMGTIIRSAAACGIYDLIAIECCDLTAPKTVRSTMGGIFSMRVSYVDRASVAKELSGYKVFALDMRGENIYNISKRELDCAYALAVGSEAHGISDGIRAAAYKIVSLPMSGATESLNAAVSLSVGLYQLVYGNKI
ncbi:MAG: RNA methyltransferase [Clostridia bacterium]|nr:RNA methyltransferase [Clostridia bacterium]